MRERPLSTVPWPVLWLLMLGFCLQIAWHFSQPKPQARAEDLLPPPTIAALHLVSLGDPIPLARALMLNLQAFDTQPGIGLSYRQLDFAKVEGWLERILELDPRGQYPLMVASKVFGSVNEPSRQRRMFEFVYHQFLLDPDNRWPWLAHAAVMAKHRLHDLPLARKYARAIREHATGDNVPSWAKQMEIFILEDMNELESAKILLGGLLKSGKITDPGEMYFLMEELKRLERR
ncbi:MAG: hypothetical protein KGZ83_05760 [Sulfuricella sp.]|nr:hypothetical protein [Sulfuricella sp.]